ncbi:hypothetical protein PS673_02051 [Pseudomonas fluorescens]|jgi:predicted ATPase|uniref:ATPase AAA-type core domain-containing protein n=1 Tax=Pseudomonas fluorescens TaxID=294 RepID=A0A5E6SKJ9_PSEFL|nr:ATP-binding protein [Pseudomonas fluorescens]VVM76508.1 hypothetical protein PS673_02051 [Pseudomonas fluorescens]
MPLIQMIDHDNRAVRLLPTELLDQRSNAFTVVVGKNGVGKSRLLTNIVKANTAHRAFVDPLDGFSSQSEELVIAVSTNAFDKFPVPPRSIHRKTLPNYRYVGIRAEFGRAPTPAVTLISSAAKGLLRKLLSGQDLRLSAVFRSLQFSPVVEFVLKPSFSRVNYFDHAEVKYKIHSNEYFFIKDDLGEELRIDKSFRDYYAELPSEAKERLAGQMANLARHFESAKALTLQVDFMSGACMLDGNPADFETIQAIYYLMNASPILRIMDVRLDKLGYGDLSLRRASSGEQCMLIMMLGIAGHIENDSLILIDEPEVSLHPRWQEEFMPLLDACFETYTGCHFIVATHSPQIISRMNNDNSFILSLSDGQLYSAKDFIKKSADYQLAVLFDAPGLMNEYISRFSFNLIAKLKSRNMVNFEINQDMEKLLELKAKLEDVDPLKNLIASVEELFEYYANNQ